MILAPIVAIGPRAVAIVVMSATLPARSVEVTSDDLVPDHLTTVWVDETCSCRRVEVAPLVDVETGPLAPVGTLFVDTAEAP